MSQVFFIDEFNFTIKKNMNIFKFMVGILFYNIKSIKLIFLCYEIQFSSHNQTTHQLFGYSKLSYLLSIFLLMNPNFFIKKTAKKGTQILVSNKMFEI